MSDSSRPWVHGLTFGEALARTVGRFGERDAVVFPGLGLRWNYAEFDRQVKRVARALVALGIQPGEHVGIWTTNRPQFILAQFATASIGAVLVNVNPAYRVHELSYVLGQADIAVLLTVDAFKTSNYEALLAEVVPELGSEARGRPFRCETFPHLRHVVSIQDHPSVPGIRPWSEFLEQGDEVPASRLEALGRAVKASTPVSIQYTSGTTGHPKGATLSHQNLLMNAWYVGQRMRFGPEDRLNIAVPFYHCFGSVMGTLMCSLYGAAMVVPAESFNPEATLAAVEAERCTALYGVPTMFNAELHCPGFGRYDLSSLRTGIMAGSPCPVDLMRKVIDLMHLPEITIAYGLTEASPVITQTEPEEPLEIRVATVGRSLPGLEVRIVDTASGVPVAEGEQGELWVRGHGVMLGYHKMPEETAAAITADGWLRTGDLAVRRRSGHYQITGRIKDMLIRGGENISPREIEEYLHTHPKVRDVQVVGVPDPHYGEQACAWIVPVDGAVLHAGEIQQFCRGRIAHFKVPHYVLFAEEFPLTVTGKVQKFRLRELAVERLGLRAEQPVAGSAGADSSRWSSGEVTIGETNPAVQIQFTRGQGKTVAERADKE